MTIKFGEKTDVTISSGTNKILFDATGAIGLGGANYGNPSQVLTSNGSGSAVSWETPITYTAGTGLNLVGTEFRNTAPDQIVTLTQGGSTTIVGTYPNFTISSTDTNTTYTQGTGVSINDSNVISIGQAVGSSDSPSFNQLSLGFAGVNQGIINLKDVTNVGTENVVQIKGIKENANGGQLQIFTKVDGGSLTERLSIAQTGLVSIKTDGVGLLIASQDGITEQGFIYNSGFGTKDFVIDAQVGSLAKGIAFRIGGNDRLKIGNNGQLGIGGAVYGNNGDVLTSQGPTFAPIWSAPAPPAPTPAYHSVSVDEYFNNNTGHVLQTFGNKITPVNIISSGSLPFKIPVGGAGVYQISFGFWMGYGAAFSLGQAQCLINGSANNNQRVFYERNNTVNRDFITASRTFIEPLNDNDEIIFYVSIYFGSGTYRCIGQCGISKIA